MTAINAGLAIAREQGLFLIGELIAPLLIAAATTAGFFGEARLAAVLLGYFKQHLEPNRIVLAIERPAYDGQVKTLHEKFSPTELHALMAQGASLQADEMMGVACSNSLFAGSATRAESVSPVSSGAERGGSTR